MSNDGQSQCSVVSLINTGVYRCVELTVKTYRCVDSPGRGS